ncbi:hypothetical protein ABZ793_12100 [Micromonospora sp. NPDC047465]|uniref:hypothetical protein n=1 Tax=Micromonospora sp. NPDC047465 TaxID=3154813 RepID=UPI0033E95C67
MSAPDPACPDYPNECVHPWAHARTRRIALDRPTPDEQIRNLTHELSRHVGALQDANRRIDRLEADLRSAQRALASALAERDQARRIAESLKDDLADAAREIADQAALIERMREHDEQRDRIWPDHDTSGQEG